MLVEQWTHERGVSPQSGLRYWQEQTLDALLLIGVVLGAITLVPAVMLACYERLYWIAILHTALFFAAFVLLTRRDLSYATRATGGVAICFLIGLGMFFAPGPFAGAPVWLFVPPVLAGILGDRNAAAAALIVNAVTLVLLGLLGYLHVVELPLVVHPERWLIFCLNFMLLDLLATTAVVMIVHGLEGTLSEEFEIRKSLREKNFELSVAYEQLEAEIAKRQQVEAELRHHRDHLEVVVNERTADLRFRNAEMRAFTYSVSHDLRSPLRAIAGFGEILVDEQGPKLDAAGREYLMRMCAAARQMDRLIDGLLWLSRSSRTEMHYENFDLSKLASEIIEDFRRQEPARQVDVTIAPSVLARGDRALLGSALEHLLGNAWKFTGCRERGCIEFGIADDAADPTYFVRDNGAGFDMRFAGKLFGVFQRLHGKSEFPGTGIGLALVQRIIERHGGHVWAQAGVDEGATFYFSLPSNGNGKLHLDDAYGDDNDSDDDDETDDDYRTEEIREAHHA